MCIVDVKNITKKYEKKVIFNQYNLKVQEGEFIALTGKSGSGKTTLLNMIGLLEEPDSGEIVVCGVENPKIDSRIGRELLKTKISYLFQNFGLIDDRSVEYNIRIAARFLNEGRNKSNREIINQSLETVGLAGYEKKKIFQLSGGEQQRVALAKIIVKPTSLILADEPTGSLDDGNRELVMKILKKLHQEGKTIIMVTHDERAASYADKIEEISSLF